jgi:hypothetical protein
VEDYADPPGEDCSISFEREDYTHRVLAILDKRLGRFGLALHPAKTRLWPCWRPPQEQQSGKGPAPSDFVGRTFYWTRTRKGHGQMGETIPCPDSVTMVDSGQALPISLP